MEIEAETGKPVLITNRYVADAFFDDVQLEFLKNGLCRIRLIRDRVTTDGVPYREPVINLLCFTSNVAAKARTIFLTAEQAIKDMAARQH